VLTERYEALRARVLARSTGGDRYGLALLLREGMAAWIAAWSSCSSPPPLVAAPTLPFTDLAPPTAEWGSMIADGQQFITTQWEQATIPGLAVVITSLGLSWLGDGLSDLLSPDRRK